MTVMYKQELLTPVNEPTNVQVFKNIMEYDNNKLNLTREPAPDKSRLPSFIFWLQFLMFQNFGASLLSDYLFIPTQTGWLY